MLKTVRTALMVGVAATLMAATAQAGNVTVKGVHLCCGQCVKAVGKALSGVDGVSGAACDRDARTVSFQAASKKAAKHGVKALAKAGFHGTAKHGDKKIALPKSGAKKGQTADSVTVSGLHICCGQCVKAIGKALNSVDGVEDAACDRESRSCTAKGSDIKVLAVVRALNKAGFHGKVK